MIKVYLEYRNIYEILKLLVKKNELIGLHFVDSQAWSVDSLGTAPSFSKPFLLPA